MRILNTIPLRQCHREQQLAYAFRENCFVVETILKDDCTPAEISDRIRQIATDAMAKSAVYEDIDSEDKPFGGFKRKNISSAFDLFPSDTVSLMSLLFGSNIDPCPPRTHPSGMCIRALINTNVTATLRCRSRPSNSRTRSKIETRNHPCR